ncbi:hypothetical protein MNBD_GAMMA15-1268 [hydrothermal vent metagenome]|uniref:Lipoprotein n=1 Tax=hydrothermal vent metagenome TaxID=652676 RepID=A0A3B0Z043_9ZZZZ
MVTIGGALMNRLPRIALLAAVTSVLFLSGCATQKPPIYRWGEYEQLVYEMYAKPGKADPGTQVAKLSEDIARTQSEGKRVPPGVHAHLGYMYYIQGNESSAMSEFALERELFPESTVFVDGMLSRLQGGAQ